MEKVEKHEKDPNDKAGLYGSGKSLKQELAAEPWDIITIQQASIRSHDVATYRPFAKQLYDYIKKYAPKSEVVLHQTWAYRRDDPRFAAGAEKPGEPRVQGEMYEGLRKSYATIAKELGVRQIPVGDAFWMADSDANWGFRKPMAFDFTSAKSPALPDQRHSLHVGWRWVKDASGKEALKMDGHHANAAGEYLGALVFYEFLFDRSPVGNTFAPPGMSKDDALFLQETAHKAVQNAKTAK
jgi:hypothetical protein